VVPAVPPLVTVLAPPLGLMVFIPCCSSIGIREQASPVNDNARPIASQRHFQIMRARLSAKWCKGIVASPGGNAGAGLGGVDQDSSLVDIATPGCWLLDLFSLRYHRASLLPRRENRVRYCRSKAEALRGSTGSLLAGTRYNPPGTEARCQLHRRASRRWKCPVGHNHWCLQVTAVHKRCRVCRAEAG